MARERGWRYYLCRVVECPFAVQAAFREYRTGNVQGAIHRVLGICHGFGQRRLMRRIMRWDADHLPMTAAAHRGDLAAVERLLASGVDIDAVTPRGVGALAAAVEANELEVAQWLLERGARVCSRSVASALQDHNDEALAQALLRAHRQRCCDPLSTELLSLAIARNQVDLTGMLLHSIAGPPSGWALQSALVNGSLAIVQLLLDHGADPNYTGGNEGRTALHIAAEAGYVDIVREMVARGADLAVRAKDGRDAAGLARRAGHEEVVRILEAAEGTAPGLPSASRLHGDLSRAATS